MFKNNQTLFKRNQQMFSKKKNQNMLFNEKSGMTANAVEIQQTTAEGTKYQVEYGSEIAEFEL